MRHLAKPAIAVAAVLYLILQFFALGIRDRVPSSWPERTVVYLTSPVQRSVEHVMGFFGNLWSHYFFLVGTSKENEILERERDQLMGQLSALREIKAENKRFRALLRLEEESELKLLAAERIASGVSPYERTIRVARGASDGVAVGMAVVHPQGVVGQISRVFDHYSDVLLLVDAASAIDVFCQRSRARGILRGERSREILLEYVPKDEDVVVGDEVVTSGLDGIYPKGLPVGEVSFVKKEKHKLFLLARLRPHVDMSRIEEVYVVLEPAP